MWKLFLHPKIGSFFIYLYKNQVNSRQFVLRKPDLQIFSRFSFAIEVQREEMRKIIMIKVILGIFGVAHLKPLRVVHFIPLQVAHSKLLWVAHLFPLRVVHLKPFPSAVGFTLRKFDGFTLRKFDGTKLLTASANGKTRKQKLIYSQMMR